MSNEKTEILVVDDSSTIRAATTKFLKAYTTHQPKDGEEGWQLLEANEDIALVFCDMHMPVMNGMQLLQKIRESDCERIANIPVIMITGHDDTEAAKKATHNLGATDFIAKPFDKVDLISRVNSYTSMSNKIAELEQDAAHDNQTGLYSDQMLLDFGKKSLSFARRHNMAVSVLFAEIADIGTHELNHGKKAAETIISSVAKSFDNSIRKEELASHIEGARFAIVLPNTKAFKAHIVATRLKQNVENLAFEVGNVTIRVSLAIGLCSTEDNDSDNLEFEEFCVRASHALATSLESPNKRITRYDETYEKKIGDDKGSYQFSTPQVTEAVEEEDEATDAFAEFFACILSGDSQKIPVEFLPTLIDQLEEFLDYARTTVDGNQKMSGE